MNNARSLTTCRTLLALAGLLLALATLFASRARAAEPVFGGLGRVGASTIKPGSEGKPGQVVPTGTHNFAVDPKNGKFFIAEEIGEGTKTVERIQEFGPKGEILAENKVSPKVGITLGGIAVDAEGGHVYMLVSELRPAVNPEIQAEIETKEHEVEVKEKKHEETKQLLEEIAKLEVQEQIFSPEVNAAAEVWEFSTEATSGKLKEPKALSSAEVLQPLSESAKVPVLTPGGIAVDEKNHEVVLLGQQNESSSPEEEQLHTTVVQRIHETDGTLGPRYVDQENCLFEGHAVAAEPACAQKPAEESPRSPVVTPQGNVYVELTGNAGEVWMVPTPGTAGETFKEVPVIPKRAFSLSTEQQQQTLVNFGGSEEVANTMSFVASSETEGKFFINVNVEGNLAGVLVLDYVEHEGKTEVTERGWTGGQSQVSKQEKCAIPAANGIMLLGGNSSGALILDTRPALKTEEGEVPALIDVMEFGPSGEHCGHVKVSPPVVKYKEQNNAEEVPVEEPVAISSTVTGANAKATKWTFKPKGSGVEEGPFETGYQFETTSLTHAFLHAGEYEVVETLLTDNLGEPEVTAEKRVAKLLVTQAGGNLSAKIKALGPVHAEEPVTFEVTVNDATEPKPHLKYKWSFGDGTAPVEESEEASGSPVVHKATHTYARTCLPVSCSVSLTVTDGSGHEEKAHTEVRVLESAAEERRHAEERKHAEEVAAAAAKAAGEAAANAKRAGELKAAEEAAAAAKAAEEAAHKGVLHAKETHNPEAKVAGASVSVGKTGSFALKLTCPAGQSECVGTVTLRTLSAVSAKKKTILTLASVSFSLTGGQLKSVTLHLSAKAKSLLAHMHTLRALATVVAHDASGTTRTTRATVTLKASHKH